ncbi:MAG: 30S ribosomal protein S6 [Candidatus Omnitrophica bacterium]|nr:30S ribosomal protein S6 [Candidatus Omnitrophota bacterium]
MRKYEALVLIDPSLGGESINDGLNKVEEIVKKRGGTIDQRVEHGKKRLGYVIKKKKDAYVYTIIFKVDSTKITEIEYDIRLVAEVLRCSIFNQDDNKKFPGNLSAVTVGAERDINIKTALKRDDDVDEDEE